MVKIVFEDNVYGDVALYAQRKHHKCNSQNTQNIPRTWNPFELRKEVVPMFIQRRKFNGVPFIDVVFFT